MSAVRTAVYQKLSGTTAITSKLSSATAIYHGQAPPNAAYPFLVFHKQSGTPDYSFGAKNFDWEVWMVKAVDRSTSSTVAEAIQAAVDAALTGATLTIGGRFLADLRRTSDIDFLENSGDQQYRHHGALYRVVVL